MAIEAIRQDLGFVVSAADYRNSTNTGTTHAGPSGSAQFMAVQMSTSVSFTVGLTTAAGAKAVGILQNKPASGEAADVTVFGVSKCVAGSTAIAPGMDLMVDSSGCLIPYSSAAGQYRAGRSMESAGTVGQIFSAEIYGFTMGGGSVA